MKIAQVTPYDIAHPGGVGQHIFHLQQEFEKLGHEVVVMAPRSAQGGLEVKPGFYGVGRPIPIPANGSKARLMFDVTLYNAVKEVMTRERFDVVHMHEPLTPLLPYIVLLNSLSLNVATFHAARETNPWYVMLKPYFGFLMSRLDQRICVSEPARRNISQHFPDSYQIIPNGIDMDRYNEEVTPFPWAERGPRILFVGRFNEARKGFKYLLRALPMIQQQFPDARLTVVGPGDRTKFSDMLQRFQIRGVEFMGEVPWDDLPRYYASCDIFCAPSIHGESFGIVLLEAMASFKPVIASDIPGYAGVVTNNFDGLLVQPRDSASIALAVVHLLSDELLRTRLAQAGRQTAEKYTWPNVASQILDVYRAGLASTQPALVQGTS